MATLIGHSVGRYQIIEQLGRGGMATVYKAFDSRLDRDVAIKFIRPDVVDDEMFLKRFEREAKALAGLSHPHIVKVLDYGEYEGRPYLVMEYVRGDTLKKKLGQPIPWKESAKMLAPVARTLDYIHKHKIIHRDVKPANFLVNEINDLLLSDFGIAKMLDRKDDMQLTGTGVGIGTPEYMAPEQGMGQSVDGRADIYALGIVFYEMLTGQKPYQADTPMAVMFKQISEPLPSPKTYLPNLPDAVTRVLFKALAKKPEDRYQTMEEFGKALDGLERMGDLEDHQTRIEPQPGQTQRRDKEQPIPPIIPPAAQPVSTPTAPPVSYPSAQMPVSDPYQSQPAFMQEKEPQPKKKKKVWITCGVGFLIVACVVIMLVTGGFGALMAIFGPDPAGLTVVIEQSSSPLILNQESTLKVICTNDGDKEFTIDSISMDNTLREAILLFEEDIYPKPSDMRHLSSSVYFDHEVTLQPGETYTQTFLFTPYVAGEFTGNVNAHVGTRVKIGEVTFIIEDAPSGQTNQQPTSTTLPQPTNTAQAQGSYVLLYDEFRDPNSGWEIGEFEEAAVGYKDGIYFIYTKSQNNVMWGYYPSDYADITIEFDATQFSSPANNNNDYGVMCRQQEDASGYAFNISGDGWFSIQKAANNEYIDLLEWTQSDVINQGNDTNHILVVCDGTKLALYVNGQLLGEAEDSTFTSGSIALTATTYEEEPTEIHFDEIVVTEAR